MYIDRELDELVDKMHLGTNLKTWTMSVQNSKPIQAYGTSQKFGGWGGSKSA
jgi:hypothetical protein